MKKHWFGLTAKQWIIILVVIPGVPFCAVSGFIIVYANLPWPKEYRLGLKEIEPDVRELVVLVHGKGDTPDSWANGFAADIEAAQSNRDQQVLSLDWSEYSKDMFRCSLNGRRIGHTLARRILENSNIGRLHVIGHSAGSFVVYGICEMIKKSNRKIEVQTTYLSPVSIYGGLDWKFGTRNFGSCADISDAYIDTEDKVPGSNKPLKYPHTFDVTALKHRTEKVIPHLWPVAYYRQAVLKQQLPLWNPDKSDLKQYPPGQYTVY